MLPNKKRKGFTLIELLVVIAIIGILSAIGLIAVNSARERSRDVTRKSDIKQLSIGLVLYYDSNDSTYPNSATAGVNTWKVPAAAQLGERADAVGCPACLVFSALVGATKHISRLPNAQVVGPTTLSRQFWYVSCEGKGSTGQTSAGAYALITELERPTDATKSWWVFKSTSSDGQEVAPTGTPCS